MTAENEFSKSAERLIDLESDLLSREDAIDCLTGKAYVILPTPNVRACNNLDEYFARSTSKSQTFRKCPSTDHPSTEDSESSTPTLPPEPLAVPLVRNFQRIIKKSSINTNNEWTSNLGLIRKPKKLKPDVFRRTERDTTTGPLLLLSKRIDNTVKVLIRRRRKVPYISRTIEYKGTLSLFDKHMNLYLTDVIESFKYSIEDKIVKRVRHRDKILLRGDNIIMIF